MSDPKERSTILVQVDYFALDALAREPGFPTLTRVLRLLGRSVGTGQPVLQSLSLSPVGHSDCGYCLTLR